ncbi:hypothetical protein GW17_00035423 [Ensete ventricosum]|nr:hypothetical protein GW17_00035423 [Ensete ventricosum]
MTNHPGEVSRVRRIASVVCRRGSSTPHFKRLPRSVDGRSCNRLRPSYLRTPLCGGGKGIFIPAQTSWSYVGHVVAIALDRSPTSCRQGSCSSVDFCPDTPPVVSYQGLGDTVHRSATTFALTRRPSSSVNGLGYYSRASLTRRFCFTVRYQGRQLVNRRITRGYLEVRSDTHEVGDTMFYASLN